MKIRPWIDYLLRRFGYVPIAQARRANAAAFQAGVNHLAEHIAARTEKTVRRTVVNPARRKR